MILGDLHMEKYIKPKIELIKKTERLYAATTIN